MNLPGWLDFGWLTKLFSPSSTSSDSTPSTNDDQTEAAQGQVLKGDPGRYNFTAYVDGNDICFDDVQATWFGGPDDPDDDGETASGYSTYDNPFAMYCALPMPKDPACRGTPLPDIPWGTDVQVRNRTTGKLVTVQVRDYGPAPSGEATGSIDLSPGAFQTFGSAMRGAHGAEPITGSYPVDVRIMGGARFVKTN